MKTGNVIAAGAKGGVVKEPGRGRREEKAMPSTPETAAKGRGSAAADLAAQKFLSVRQVAKRWGASESTVRRLIEEGELNGIRLRHACKLSIDSVKAYEKRAEF